MKPASLCLFALSVLTAGCSGEPAANPDATATPAVSARAPQPSASPIMSPDGLGQLRIGGPVPASWGRSDQACRDLAGDGYPGAYAMARGGVIRRISARAGSGVVLEEGFGPGAPEARLTTAIPGLRAEAHKYLAAPAKVLTVPFSGDGPTLRFEIDGAGRIALMSAGVMPEIAMVEGCG